MALPIGHKPGDMLPVRLMRVGPCEGCIYHCKLAQCELLGTINEATLADCKRRGYAVYRQTSVFTVRRYANRRGMP